MEQQDHVIQAAEIGSYGVVTNLEKGIDETDKAVQHGRNKRRLQWWLASIIFIIVVAVGLGVGLGVCKLMNKC